MFAAAATPRLNSSDYPVHQDTKSATIAAELVAPGQVKKIFSNNFNKKYVVIEIAVYPRDGGAMNIDSFDFALKLGADDREELMYGPLAKYPNKIPQQVKGGALDEP
jgi:hypothetical protein